ncbi:MAG: hypothetical protein ACO1SX_14015 [Actinomycetota bacterium]
MSYSAEAPRTRCVSRELEPAVGRAMAEAVAVARRLSSWRHQDGLVEAVWRAHQEYRPGAASFMTFALARARLAMLAELRGQRRWHPPQKPILSLDALAAGTRKGPWEPDAVGLEDAGRCLQDSSDSRRASGAGLSMYPGSWVNASDL